MSKDGYKELLITVNECDDCPFMIRLIPEGDPFCDFPDGRLGSLDFERTKPPPEDCPLRDVRVVISPVREEP